MPRYARNNIHDTVEVEEMDWKSLRVRAGLLEF